MHAASWLTLLHRELERAPDPAHAFKLASGVLAAAYDELGGAFEEAADTAPEILARIFYALCGVAPFFASHLQRHPAWLLALLDEDYSRPLEPDALAARLDAVLAAEEGGAESALCKFKYRELARITVRDCDAERLPLALSGESLRELSQLADLLLDRALRIAQQRICDRFGPPRWRSADGSEATPGFCVLGLGKLGGLELNFSSDVDLVYIHEFFDVTSTAGGQELTPDRYYARVAQELGTIVSAATGDGFLYRVDLELRPEGSQGLLVVSDRAFETYYAIAADTWEKAAVMKARPVAGDLQLGWRSIRALAPMIYRSSMDYSAVQGIQSLKERVADAHGERRSGFNVKLDAGGIRDLEFVAQAMQLLHGGRIPQLRERGTQGAFENLAAVGLLPTEEIERLLHAYHFLRRVENRMQMEGERQVHVLPADPVTRGRIACTMGFRGEQGLADFDAYVAEQRRFVQGFFAGFLVGAGRQRVLDIFERSAPRAFGHGPARAMLEHLADAFARQIDASHDPPRALNNLDRFIAGVGGRSFYYELLLDRPELAARLCAVFATSRFLSDYFARFPRLIEPVFADPEVLLLSRSELEQDLLRLEEEPSRGEEDPIEGEMEVLRLFHHRHLLNVGVLDIDGKISRQGAERALTEIAEVCLEKALGFARAHRGGVVAGGQGGRFLVVAMGKLASFELSYGSDLDLIFLYDIESDEESDLAAAQEEFVRTSRRLIALLQTSTTEGTCYEVDTRLRPSGNQGTLVSSMASFRRYHAGSAQSWERQALLRARPVAGSRELAAEFLTLRTAILSGPVPANLAEEVDHVRQRMEGELARETDHRWDFKTGCGGTLDVESVVQYLCLRHGGEHPQLWEDRPIEDLLERLEGLDLIYRESADALREGWSFLQQLGNRLRIVENRSISELDEERGDLDGLALQMGYAPTGRESGARRRLLRDYRRHTEAIRAVYHEVLGRDNC